MYQVNHTKQNLVKIKLIFLSNIFIKSSILNLYKDKNLKFLTQFNFCSLSNIITYPITEDSWTCCVYICLLTSVLSLDIRVK